MTLRLAKITRENYQECLNLKVAHSQTGFVAANSVSLAQTAYEPKMYPLAIYNQQEMVGFVLYDFDLELNDWSMSRLMIGEQFQAQGFGKKALTLFLNYFFTEVDAAQIYTSVEVDNPIAKKLYLQAGFKEKETFSYTIADQEFHEERLLLKKADWL